MQFHEAKTYNKLKSGDERVLKLFFDHHFPLFVSFAENFNIEAAVCQDIVQDIFIKYWDQKEQFDHYLAVKAYFYTSIRNQCLNYLKHEIVHSKFVENQSSEIESVEYFWDTIIKEEALRIVYEEVQRLSKMENKILLLALSGLSNEEIAVKLNISINTVKTHKARSYQVLRKRLGHLRQLILLLG